MKRDFDLIRKILLEAESYEHGNYHDEIKIDGYTREQIEFHVYLMHKAGLVNASDISTAFGDSPAALFHGITWDGYDFLASIKDETLWEKAKSTVIKPAAGITFELLVAWLKQEAKQRLGIS